MPWTLADELESLKSAVNDMDLGSPSNERLLQLITETTPGVVYIFRTADNTSVFVTPEIRSVLGYEPEEWLSDPGMFVKAVHPDDLETITEMHRELENTADDRHIRSVQRMRHKNRSWRTLSCRETVFARDAHGHPALIIGHAHDITEEVQTERALRESEVQARAMLDAIPDLMFWFASDTTILSCHPHQSNSFVRPPGEFLGRKAADVLPPEIASEAKDRIRAVLSNGEPQVYEYSTSLDGATLFWETRMVPSGEDQVLAIVRDVTERKRAEEDLRASERRYRRFFETSKDAVFITSRDGRWIDANEVAVELFGCESMNQLFQTRVPDLYADPVQREQHLSTIEQQGFTEEYPVDLRRLDGRVIHTIITSVPVYDESGRAEAFQGTIRDITEQRRAEEALRESETRYRLLVERNVAGIYRSTIDGRVLECNQAFAGIFGYDSPLEALERGAAELYQNPEDRHRFLDELRHSGNVSAWEVTLRRSDGRPIQVILSAVLLEDETGTPEIIEGSLIDVTALRRLEERLHRSQRLEAVGKLAGGIAHDFNNILQAMYMQIDLGLADTDDPAVEKRLRTLLQSTERARKLIRQLLAFGRRQRLEMEAIDLNDVVHRLMEMFERVIPENIEIEFRPCRGVPLVEADPVQLEQVVTNLAINARDAMPDGGTLTIATEEWSPGPETRETREWAVSDHYVVLTLADTGTGMDVETQRRAFEPFFTTKEPGLGTGLGLATVHGIVGQHEGGIEVSSEPGRGTTVSVFLRTHTGSTEKLGGDGPKGMQMAPALGGTETVLLAEDDASLLELAATVLQDAGYSVVKASDGAEAVDLLREDPHGVDLAVLDVVMPRKSGLEALEEMRAIRPDLPALFSSGYTDNPIAERATEQSGADLLHKPYPPDVLLREVRRLLDNRGVERRDDPPLTSSA